MSRPLRPLKGTKQKKPEIFAVIDIETKNWTDFLVLGYFDGADFFTFTSIVEFIGFALTEAKKLGGRLKIYAHNGGKFDFLFLLQVAFFLPDIQIKNMIPRGSGILSFEIHYKNTVITFVDSLAILPFSLDSITKSFNVEHKKQKWDHRKTTGVTPELIDYLRDDCRGLFQSLMKYREWPLIEQAGAKSTMASQALQVFRLFLKQPIPSLDAGIDEFVRGSYFGGRVEVFKSFYHDSSKPLRCYDVNSLYPTVMLRNEFPTHFDCLTNEWRPDRMGFYDALVEVPEGTYIPPLPTVQKVGKSNKLVFPTGKFWGRWSTIELNYAQTQGVKILKIGQGVLFHSGGHIFRDYIKTLYDMRLEAQRLNDPVTDILTKLLMNSLYGRFGLNRERTNLVVDDGKTTGLSEYCILESDMGSPVRLMEESKVLEDTFSNVAIAAWVTSHARIHMHQIYMQAPEELYYTDTDSLFTTAKLPTGKNLGELKLEYEGYRACFVLPKTYMIDEIVNLQDKKTGHPITRKLTMKGFEARKIKDFTPEDFVATLEGELRLKTRKTHYFDDKGVCRVCETPKSEASQELCNPPGLLTFKKALKKGSLVHRNEPEAREIRSQYDKRRMLPSKDSKPLHIEQLTHPHYL